MEIIDINQKQQRTQHRTLGDTITNLQIEECVNLKNVYILQYQKLKSKQTCMNEVQMTQNIFSFKYSKTQMCLI